MHLVVPILQWRRACNCITFAVYVYNKYVKPPSVKFLEFDKVLCWMTLESFAKSSARVIMIAVVDMHTPYMK